MTSILDEIAKNMYDPTKKAVVTTKETLRLVPDRTRRNLASDNTKLVDTPARQAGDCFWRAGVELAKHLYVKIDNRYPESERLTDPEKERYHKGRMAAVKKILQEQRNDVFEAVLPLFIVKHRYKDDTVFTEADQHAHDYFLKNCFYMLVQNYLAWLPEFVEPEDIESTRQVILNLADNYSEKIDRELKNFSFSFRPLKVL